MINKYEQISSFKDNGFILIPDVLDTQAINNIREKLYNFNKEKNPDNYKSFFNLQDIVKNRILMNEVVMKMQFNDKIVNTLKKIIPGDTYYINDFHLLIDSYGLGGGNSGWHCDANSEFGNSYLHNPDYCFGKVGIYLQDNTFTYGGGIDVIPGSHKSYRYFKGLWILQVLYTYISQKFRVLIHKYYGKYTVPIKAGSAVFFDSRLQHRASFPDDLLELERRRKGDEQNYKLKNEDKNNMKLVFYWEACSMNDYKSFMINACKRSIIEILNKNEDKDNEIQLFFSQYLSVIFPNDYPKEYIDAVKKINNISIASIDENTAKVFKSAL